MYTAFDLTLAVTGRCNLRCDYCYMGDSHRHDLPFELGEWAIDCAVNSTESGGRLTLGFFGGEPLLVADAVLAFMTHARTGCAKREIELRCAMTTNGTVDTDIARRVMAVEALELAVSCDGLGEIHDRHRRRPGGGGSFANALALIDRLTACGRPPSVVMVIRPDTVAAFPEGLTFLLDRGIRRVVPSLDLTASWRRSDLEPLRDAVSAAASEWGRLFPTVSVSCFDGVLARTTGHKAGCSVCRFGDGEVAIGPRGGIYPCERLIGTDDPANPHRLALDLRALTHFRAVWTPPPVRPCTGCSLRSACNVQCRCANAFRTGDYTRPDELLCVWNKACIQSVGMAMETMSA